MSSQSKKVAETKQIRLFDKQPRSLRVALMTSGIAHKTIQDGMQLTGPSSDGISGNDYVYPTGLVWSRRHVSEVSSMLER